MNALKVTVTFSSTLKGASVPPPLIVRLLTPLPLIASAVEVSLNSSVPWVSVIVCGVENTFAVSKTTVLGAGLG